jgi:hypothetical protein
VDVNDDEFCYLILVSYRFTLIVVVLPLLIVLILAVAELVLL